MNRLLIVIFLICNISFVMAQCPGGPRPNFWHPDQVDSFKIAHPNCDKYNYQYNIIDGEYIKPGASESSNALWYVITLLGLLAGIIYILHLITTRIRYFKG